MITRTNTHQTTKACSTNKVYKNRFDRVFFMMSHTNTISSQRLFQLKEITITQITCSHLDAHLMQIGISLCIEMDFMEWDILTLTEVLTKLFIPQTLLST